MSQGFLIRGRGPVAETDIADGTLLARVAADETISGNWLFTGTPEADEVWTFHGGLTVDGGDVTIGTLAGLLKGTAGVVSAVDFTDWTVFAYAAGNFAGGGSQTWTVDDADEVVTYRIIGKSMLVTFYIEGSTVGGTPDANLNLKIPASKTATRSVMTNIHIIDNGTEKQGVAYVGASGTTINFNTVPYGNWTASTNNTRVRGQIEFEIN